MTLQRQLLNRDLCLPGLVIASLLFALSLTPSLLPRPYLLQALLSGFIIIAGYGIGVFLVALWRYLGLSVINDRLRRALRAVSLLICAALLIQSLLYWQDWQNELRTQMGMELLGSGLEFAVIGEQQQWPVDLLGKFDSGECRAGPNQTSPATLFAGFRGSGLCWNEQGIAGHGGGFCSAFNHRGARLSHKPTHKPVELNELSPSFSLTSSVCRSAITGRNRCDGQ